MTDQLIGTIQNNSREQIRIALSEFRGHHLANLRIWFEADDGDMRSGNKGDSLVTFDDDGGNEILVRSTVAVTMDDFLFT